LLAKGKFYFDIREQGSLLQFVMMGLLLLVGAGLEADYQSGLDAYSSGNYDLAIREWQAVVESPPGTVLDSVRAEALYAIGMMFWLGQGVQQDTSEAASWLQLSAELQHPGAQSKLAFLYSTGQGVKQSTFEALKWWQMAANQGDADAQYNLGVAYRDGLGVQPDADLSIKWFREAAANGNYLSAAAVENYEQTGSLLTVHGTRITPRESLNGRKSLSIPGDDTPVLVSDPVLEKEIEHGPSIHEYGEDWIRQRAPDNYTIQVIALSAPEKLLDYIRLHPELEPLAIYAQSRYQQPIWVMVQGDYSDLESARMAVQNFPTDMQQRDKLWIRHFKMVQGLLE